MAKKNAVIVNQKELKRKGHTDIIDKGCIIHDTQNVYLSAFLISQDHFKLGRVYIEDLSKDNKANVEIQYDPKYQLLLNNYLDIYKKNKAVVNLSVYQQNIRFIMHLINKRKSGLVD